MKFINYGASRFKASSYYKMLPQEEQEVFDMLSGIFHFKANNYVLENLIDWSRVPEDPIYRLVFPRKDMLPSADYGQLRKLYQLGLDGKSLQPFLMSLRNRMTPRVRHYDPSMPVINGERSKGIYHTFRNIANLSPSPMMKTCHAYCSYCFRWIFFEEPGFQKETSYTNPFEPVPYLQSNPQITDVLFTGADPLVLNAIQLRKFITPLLEVDSLKVIRINSKALAWWPFRFITDKDAIEMLSLFKEVHATGKHLSLSAHFTHPRELEHEAVQEAIRRIQSTGTSIHCQGPLVQGINDSTEVWSDLWTRQVQLGMTPYAMFVEANHHPESCFRPPLASALKIFQEAQRRTTGLARTVNGPVFVNDLNRIALEGTTELGGQKYFVLKSLQCPPGTSSEGKIKLIPYDEETNDFGDLFELFEEESSIECV